MAGTALSNYTPPRETPVAKSPADVTRYLDPNAQRAPPHGARATSRRR